MKFKLKIHNYIFIAIWVVLIGLTVPSLIFYQSSDVWNVILMVLTLLWTVALTYRQFLLLYSYKTSIKADLPEYLAQIYNAGIITKEQLDNPGKREIDLFFNEYANSIRTRKFIIAMTIFLGVCLFVKILFL